MAPFDENCKQLFDELPQHMASMPNKQQVQTALDQYLQAEEKYKTLSSVKRRNRTSETKKNLKELKKSRPQIKRALIDAVLENAPSSAVKDLAGHIYQIESVMNGKNVDISKLLGTENGRNLLKRMQKIRRFKEITSVSTSQKFSGNIKPKKIPLGETRAKVTGVTLTELAESARARNVIRVFLGKSCVVLAMGLCLLDITNENGKEIPVELYRQLEKEYNNIEKELKLSSGKCDYVVSNVEAEDLIQWAYDHTDNPEERKMLNEIRGERYNYNVYEYVLDKNNINMDLCVGRKLPEEVIELFKKKMELNINGQFYTEINRLKTNCQENEKQNNNTSKESKDNEAKDDNASEQSTKGTLTQTLSGAEKNASSNENEASSEVVKKPLGEPVTDVNEQENAAFQNKTRTGLSQN